MGWAGHVARMEKMSGAYTVYDGGNLEQKNNFEDLWIDGKIILRWIFKKWDEDMDWTNLNQDRGKWRVSMNWLMKFRAP